MTEIMNKIIYGDNLRVMRKQISDESVDLIYLDPPFFSGRDYEIIFGDEDKFPGFSDIWKGEDGEETRVGGIEVYKNFMRERLVECHRVLKSTGTIFLHCDKHANHHLRLLLDEIFGTNNFLNEIIWCYTGPSGAKKQFPAKHDNIYWYSKSDEWTFNYNEIKISYKALHIDTRDKSKIPMGKLTKESIKEKLESGKIPEDWWIGMSPVGRIKSERLGYPTQKPESLLKRIILAASNEGDVVMDPFCGCGTTIAVAKRLKRKFIGIDWSWVGCGLMAERIGFKLNDIVNRPMTSEDFENMDGFQWQGFACHLLGAKPNPKVIGDGGIDGWFPDGTAIQVKKGKVGNKYIERFATSIQIDKKSKGNIGLFVGASFSKNAEEVIVKIAKKMKIKIVTITNEKLLYGEGDKFDKLIKAGIGHEYGSLDKKYYWKLPEQNGFVVVKKKDVKSKTLTDWLVEDEDLRKPSIND